MFAIIEASGHQYKVNKGDIFCVDFTDQKEGSTLKFDNVLALGDDKGTMKLGSPYIKGSVVEAKVVKENVRGDKLKIIKYTAKKRHKLTKGFRHTYSEIEIVNIK